MSDVPFDDGNCFACGPENPIGMHLHFERAPGEGVISRATLGAQFQGWRGIAHGGIVMMLLDEAMAHACRFAGDKAVTASADVRFRAPVPLGVPLAVRGRVRERRRNVLFLEATVARADAPHEALATAAGTFVSQGPLREIQART